MTPLEPAYHLKQVRHFYGSERVLNIADLKIEQGSITGLIGPNGSGKSTLLKILAFALKPTQGTILFKGLTQSTASPHVRTWITLLTQKPYLLKRTVFENIAYGLKIRKDTDRVEERVKQALLKVGLSYDKFAERSWHALSGGEAQRVAMAARLILKPEVLLLDEPIASVDTESARLIRQASLKARNDWGTTLVIASHDLQWLYTISDLNLSIFKGNIFSSGLENIITGPFEKSSARTWVKPLPDGQVIRVKAPEKDQCTAVIRKKNISISLEPLPEKTMDNQLSGHIVSMLLEKKTGHILTTIAIHDQSFVVRLTADQVREPALAPGRKILFGFSADQVEWV